MAQTSTPSLPFMKLYTTNLLTALARMSPLEGIIYVHLLLYGWEEQGSIPNDRKRLKRWLPNRDEAGNSIPAETFDAALEFVLSEKYIRHPDHPDTRLVNPRQYREWLEAHESTQRKSDQARQAANRRWQRERTGHRNDDSPGVEPVKMAEGNGSPPPDAGAYAGGCGRIADRMLRARAPEARSQKPEAIDPEATARAPEATSRDPDPEPLCARAHQEATTEKSATQKQPDDMQRVVAEWNARAEGAQFIRPVRHLTEKRRLKLAGRLKDPTWCACLPAALERADTRIPRTGWAPTFDWLIDNGNNAVKLAEGAYEDRQACRPDFVSAWAAKHRGEPEPQDDGRPL